MLGVTRQRVARIVNEDPTFPDPLATLATGRVWERSAIVAWARSVGREYARRGDGRRIRLDEAFRGLVREAVTRLGWSRPGHPGPAARD